MSSTTTTTTTATAASRPSSSKITLSADRVGTARVVSSPEGSLELANELLQKNHDDFHVFWRDVGGHNHIAHAVLTILATGGSPDELKRIYNDSTIVQRAIPPVDEQLVRDLSDPAVFSAHMSSIPDYSSFLEFFQREIDHKGWKEVVNEYCFARTPLADKMLAQTYEGAYHPFIHLGLGIEFELPSIIAEGLAQAATHDSAGIDGFFLNSEKEAAAATQPSKSLRDLVQELRSSEKISKAALLQDGPVRVRQGVIGRAGPEITSLASQYRVSAADIDLAVAEMISCNAYICGAAQRPGKVSKIDFFFMHNITSSLFLTVMTKQPWIKIEDKVRLIEWKSRLDLVWYAACSAPVLDAEAIANYEPTLSKGMDWAALYQATNKAKDDGHLAKFIRAIRNGALVSSAYESGEAAAKFPVSGDLWLKVAQMSYDSTVNVPQEGKWLWGAGFPPMWAQVPDSK